MPNFCPHCGNQLEFANAEICPKCGVRIANPPPVSVNDLSKTDWILAVILMALFPILVIPLVIYYWWKGQNNIALILLGIGVFFFVLWYFIIFSIKLI